MSFAFTYFIALFASWLLIPYFIRHSDLLRMIDQPGGRKAHQAPTSRAGGLGIILAFALALTFSLLNTSEFIWLYTAAMVIVVCGVADDVWPMTASKKFAGQIVAVCIAMYGGVVIENVPGFAGDSPVALNYLVTFIFLLGVTNAVNLSDGLDGLAAGSTLMSLGLILVLCFMSDSFQLMLITIAIMGGISGFLRYNTFPARVFMGDAGSQFIGFMAAALAVLCTQNASAGYSHALPLLILGLPILDTLYVMLIRIINKRSPFMPDQNHLHHRLIRLNFPHHEAVAMVYFAQTLLMILAFTLRSADDWQVVIAFVLFAGTLLFGVITAKRTGWQRTLRRRERYANKDAERRNPVFRKLGFSFQPFTSLVSVLIVGAIVVAVVTVYASPYRDNTLGMISALAMLGLVCMILLFRRKKPNALFKLCASVAVAISFYTANMANMDSSIRYLLDAYLLLLILWLVFCVRLTRDYLDLLNNQDLLILCTLIVLPILPVERDSIYLAVRIAIAIYAIEYIVLVGRAKHELVNIGSVGCLGAIAALMLA